MLHDQVQNREFTSQNVNFFFAISRHAFNPYPADCLLIHLCRLDPRQMPTTRRLIQIQAV